VKPFEGRSLPVCHDPICEIISCQDEAQLGSYEEIDGMTVPVIESCLRAYGLTPAGKGPAKVAALYAALGGVLVKSLR
jgi:hypothetical protein